MSNDNDGENAVDFSLHITRVENGYVVSENEDVSVYEEPSGDDITPDPDTLARVLWHVVEYFGGIGSKHDARRIQITVEPGSDYNGPSNERPD
jgi:hypothetical protein